MLTLLSAPAAMACEAVAPARCWYVAKDGSDANPGTITQPLRHIWRGVQSAGPGDLVYVREGVWGRGEERSPAACAGYLVPDPIVPISRGDTACQVANGEPGRPITLAAFPGETVVLDGEPGPDPLERPIVVVYIRNSGAGAVAHWTVRGFEIRRGVIEIAGAGYPISQAPCPAGQSLVNPHHIVIEGNTIHDVQSYGPNNVGMIRADRGDCGGPYEITIRGNHIYNLRDNGDEDWRGTTDPGHYGAVTTLSPENYYGMHTTGPRGMIIEDNVLHDLPQTFFFKNPMAGPVEIRNNRIYNARALGQGGSANMTFQNNLVYDVASGFMMGAGNGVHDLDESLWGMNGRFIGNTFVGVRGVVSSWSGTGHEVRGNVLFDPAGRLAGANWDTRGVIEKSSRSPLDDPDPARSILQDMTSDGNCYVSPYADPVFVKRFLSNGSIDHQGLAGARAQFGFDVNSSLHVGLSREVLFVNPAGGDFTLRPDSPCAGYGYMPVGENPPAIPTRPRWLRIR